MSGRAASGQPRWLLKKGEQDQGRQGNPHWPVQRKVHQPQFANVFAFARVNALDASPRVLNVQRREPHRRQRKHHRFFGFHCSLGDGLGALGAARTRWSGRRWGEHWRFAQGF